MAKRSYIFKRIIDRLDVVTSSRRTHHPSIKDWEKGSEDSASVVEPVLSNSFIVTVTANTLDQPEQHVEMNAKCTTLKSGSMSR